MPKKKCSLKRQKKENLTNLDETSLLLEIEDRLGIVEGTENIRKSQSFQEKRESFLCFCSQQRLYLLLPESGR